VKIEAPHKNIRKKAVNLINISNSIGYFLSAIPDIRDYG